MGMKQKLITSTICSVVAIIAIVVSKAPELQTSQQGLEHIANAEGCRLKAYQCSASKWTVGSGHTQGINAGDVVSLEQAADYFIADIKQAEAVVRNSITQTPTQGQWDMMVSFVFNLGAGNFKKSTLLKLFNAGQSNYSCEQYRRWVYANDKNCRIRANNCFGIVERREIEREVCLNGWSG